VQRMFHCGVEIGQCCRSHVYVSKGVAIIVCDVTYGSAKEGCCTYGFPQEKLCGLGGVGCSGRSVLEVSFRSTSCTRRFLSRSLVNEADRLFVSLECGDESPLSVKGSDLALIDRQPQEKRR
jgi:hypothetical protein